MLQTESLKSRIGMLLRRVGDPARRRDRAIHPFDLQYGVDTSGLLYADELASGHAHDKFSEGYYATAPSLFYGAMSRWNRLLAGRTVEEYAFFDLGCGKGRVLMLASKYGFRSIAGVELSPKLARAARANLAKWLRQPWACGNVSVAEGDALALQLPPGPVVLYMFNSFDAKIVTALVDRLVEQSRSRSAPIDLLYVHPEHDRLVRQRDGTALLADEEIPFTAEDAAADAFDVRFDQCCIYRIEGSLFAKSGQP